LTGLGTATRLRLPELGDEAAGWKVRELGIGPAIVDFEAEIRKGGEVGVFSMAYLGDKDRESQFVQILEIGAAKLTG
jgi:hypothetical protein